MGISPWYLTSTPTAPIWTVQLVPDSGLFSVTNLTTANFTMMFKDLDTGQETVGQGSFSNLVAGQILSTGIIVPATILYQVALVEVVVSRKRVWVLAATANGIIPVVFEEDWVVQAL